jgi:hypothetical protein
MQNDTLKNAKKNEARLKLIGPTYGIVLIKGNEIIEEFALEGVEEGFFHIRIGLGNGGDDSANVPDFGEYMNSGLVTQTVEKAPSATEAAVRLVGITRPGITHSAAMGVVYNIKGVSSAIEEVLEGAFA